MKTVGKSSCADMSDSELTTVLDAMNKLADIACSKSWPIDTKTQSWRGKLIRKIVAQWNDLANKGVVRNRSLESLRRFCENITKVARLEWYTDDQFSDCIEALKAMQKRHQNKNDEQNTA